MLFLVAKAGDRANCTASGRGAVDSLSMS